MRNKLWTGTTSEEEARAYLQTRLTLFSKLMFWSFVVLVAFLAAMYWRYPEIKPTDNDIIFTGAFVGLGIMAVIWRVILVRNAALSVTSLGRIDILYAVTVGSAFGASAYLAYDLRPAGYTSLVYATFFVFTRTIIVPSTPVRTAVLAAITMVPNTIASVGLVLKRTQELPAPAFVIGGTVLAAVAVLLATIGSQVIYGLQRKYDDIKQLGVYVLVREHRRGGMGVVYIARHHLLRRETAVKVLSPDRFSEEDLARFEREVHFMSELTHPNTVAVYDYGRSSDGRLYYAMELLGGMDLKRLVNAYGPLPSARVAQILAQVCGALQEAHDRGAIHRDVTPANIILCERGGIADVAKVIDFGLVKEIAPETGISQHLVLGTVDYMAPEALTGEEGSNKPGRDIYGLGAVGYFLLTGKRVFEGKTTPDTIIQHATKAPVPPSQVAAVHIAPELEAIILRCLEKRPADRFASAADLAEALEALAINREWTRADAKEWWREHNITEAAVPANDAVTLSLSIDLAKRSE